MSNIVDVGKAWRPRRDHPKDADYTSARMRGAKFMSLPDFQTFFLPVLRVLADGEEHASVEIRERMRVQFEIPPHELLEKLKNGMPVFHNRVAWALAHLNMRRGPLGHPEAIERVRKEVYKISEYGRTILNRNPSDLTIKDLQS
jgi:restriction system protein